MFSRPFNSKLQIASLMLAPTRYLRSEKGLSFSIRGVKVLNNAGMSSLKRIRSWNHLKEQILSPCSRVFCVFTRVLAKEQASRSEAQVRDIMTMVGKLETHEKKILMENLSVNLRSKSRKEATEITENGSSEDLAIPLPTLMLLGCMSAIPFIGFGFLDNALMLLAGDLIDHSVSIYLHTSVMASAAMGNVVSGAIGMQVHGIIERMTQKLFLIRPSKEKNDSDDPMPESGKLDAESCGPSVFDLSALTPAQMNSRAAFLAGHIGGTIGIIIGLCLGMTPLLFLSSKPSSESTH